MSRSVRTRLVSLMREPLVHFPLIGVGIDPPKGMDPTLQERAWSSPIWYTPPEELITRPAFYHGLRPLLP